MAADWTWRGSISIIYHIVSVFELKIDSDKLLYSMKGCRSAILVAAFSGNGEVNREETLQKGIQLAIWTANRGPWPFTNSDHWVKYQGEGTCGSEFGGFQNA